MPPHDYLPIYLFTLPLIYLLMYLSNHPFTYPRIYTSFVLCHPSTHHLFLHLYLYLSVPYPLIHFSPLEALTIPSTNLATQFSLHSSMLLFFNSSSLLSIQSSSIC